MLEADIGNSTMPREVSTTTVVETSYSSSPFGREDGLILFLRRYVGSNVFLIYCRLLSITLRTRSPTKSIRSNFAVELSGGGDLPSVTVVV